MASIKNIAKKIVNNFKDTDNIVDGIKATAGQVGKETKKQTQKLAKKAGALGEDASKGFFSTENVERLKNEKSISRKKHMQNVDSNRVNNKNMKSEIDDVISDADVVDKAIDNSDKLDEILKERKKKIKGEYSLSQDEIIEQATDSAKYYGDSAKYHVANAGNKIGRGASWVGRNGFNVTEDADSFLGYDIKLSNKAKLLGAGAVGLYGAYQLGGSYVEGSYGEIEGGISVGTINQTFSNEYNKMVDYANGSPQGMNEFSKKTMSNNLGSKLAGVDPEIVFALHELRNGGGY